MDQGLRQRVAKVRMLAMDVDGVLTDGAMYYTEAGDEIKRFNTRDGLGIRLLHEAGINTALITGESTSIVERRALKLRIGEVHQGVDDKLARLKEIAGRHHLSMDEVAYIGDDVVDLEALRFVGLAIGVADATPEVQAVAHYVTQQRGGYGAVREVCDLILSTIPVRDGVSGQ